jgi:hypothetical protein
MAAGKRQNHLSDLRKYTLADKALEQYLLSHSNLPGKRGNIELGFSFADYVEENYHKYNLQLFQYCLALISENDERKNENGNEEFLPFCAVVALGRIGKIDETRADEVIRFLKTVATDGRWRIREAVAMAIQEIMDAHAEKILDKLIKWADEDNWLIQRALVAGLAEPRIIKSRKIAEISLEIHKKIIAKVAEETDTKNTDRQVLIKGLCYTLSVIITGTEDEGFRYLEDLMKIKNAVIRKIIRENLKKNRLKRLNHRKVLELQKATEKA